MHRAAEGPGAEQAYADRFAFDYGREPSFEEAAAFRTALDDRVARYLARHPDLATSTRASLFTFHRRPAIGMTRDEVVLLMGAPRSATRDAAVMEAAARELWPVVGAHAKEMWMYPGGWSLYFDADRLVDMTVVGPPPADGGRRP